MVYDKSFYRLSSLLAFRSYDDSLVGYRCCNVAQRPPLWIMTKLHEQMCAAYSRGSPMGNFHAKYAPCVSLPVPNFAKERTESRWTSHINLEWN